MSVDVDALIALAQEKEIPLERLINAIENSVAEGYAELPDAKPNGRAVLNRQTGEMVIYVPLLNELGERIDTVPDTPPGLDRIVKQRTRKVIKEKIRELKDASVVSEFSAAMGDVISGIVQQGRDRKVIHVDLGRWEGKIPPNEQVATERFRHGDRIKAYVVEAKQGLRGPEITLSRSHPALVKALFTLEVPELKERIVEIVGIAREPGQRSKISVRSHRGGVSAKGALIGPMGQRVNAVMEELKGEKIDIVDFSEDIATYVANALAPAKVIKVDVLDAETKSVLATVPDYQLSLAIGKDGQNSRLAHRLTQCKIEIQPDVPVVRIPNPKPEVALEPEESASSADAPQFPEQIAPDLPETSGSSAQLPAE